MKLKGQGLKLREVLGNTYMELVRQGRSLYMAAEDQGYSQCDLCNLWFDDDDIAESSGQAFDGEAKCIKCVPKGKDGE